MCLLAGLGLSVQHFVLVERVLSSAHRRCELGISVASAISGFEYLGEDMGNRKQRCVREGALASIVDSDSCADERVARGALRSQEPCLSVQLAPTGDDIEPLEVPRQDVELKGEEDKKPLEAQVPWARFAFQESHQSSERRT